jgi:hypothetical protein
MVGVLFSVMSLHYLTWSDILDVRCRFTRLHGATSPACDVALSNEMERHGCLRVSLHIVE